MKRIIYILLLVASQCNANWTTNLFDGASFQWGYGKQRANETYTGIVERLIVSQLSTNTITPRRWGSSWTLQEAKRSIASWDEFGDLTGMLTTDWADRNELSAGTFDTWFTTNSVFPQLTTNLLVTYTPITANWFTNHPHWGAVKNTNGWQHLPDVVNELTVYYSDNGPQTNLVYPYQWVIEVNEGVSFFDDADTWAGAKTLAEADYDSGTGYSITTNTSTTVSFFDVYTTSFLETNYLGTGQTQYTAIAQSSRVKLYLTNSSDYAMDVCVYWRSDGVGEAVYDTFEPYSTGVTSNWQSIVHTQILSGATFTTDWLGEYWPAGSNIVWCAGATTNDYYNAGSDEYIVGEHLSIDDLDYWHYRFDVTNGFEFVE